MFRRFFNAQASKTITSAAVVVGTTSLISRVLGLLRDRVLAGEFGAGATLDSYYAAFRIPDLIFNLLIAGVLSAGFIPVFTRVFSRDGGDAHAAAWRLVNNVLNTVMIAAALVAGIFFVWSEPLMHWLTPGFGPAQLAQTVLLSRIMLLSPILLGASAVVGGVLQSLKRFFIFSLSPILYNVGIIVGALFLAPSFGISGLAYGVVLGAGLHLLIQLPTMWTCGFRYRPLVSLRDESLRQIMHLMGPRTLSLAVNQLNLFVVTVLASLLSAGSLSVFNLANNLQSLPLGLFGISFAIAAFPTLAELADNTPRFVSALSQTFRQVLFLVIPSSALLILLRAQIVRVLFGTGRFDWEDTLLTIDALAIFSISLFSQALIPLLIRAFYALRDTMTPLLTALGASLLNITLALALVGSQGIAGLALAISIANLVQFAVLWLLLRLRLGAMDEAGILHSTGRIAVAAFLMALVTQGTKYLTAPLTGTNTFVGVAVQGGTAAAAGLCTYFLISFMLRSPEAISFLGMFRRRKAPVVVTEAISDT